MSNIRNVRVVVPEWILRRWILVAYLYPSPIAELSKYTEVELDAKAINVLHTHVKAYLEKDIAPPAQIRSVVMNIADDLANNRAPTLRTGDYIDLQSFIRK